MACVLGVPLSDSVSPGAWRFGLVCFAVVVAWCPGSAAGCADGFLGMRGQVVVGLAGGVVLGTGGRRQTLGACLWCGLDAVLLAGGCDGGGGLTSPWCCWRRVWAGSLGQVLFVVVPVAPCPPGCPHLVVVGAALLWCAWSVVWQLSLKRLKLHGIKRQKVPKIHGLKKHRKNHSLACKKSSHFWNAKRTLISGFPWS